MVMSNATGRRNLRRLTAIIDAPTLRPDGTIMERPGYDEATGLYLIPSMTIPGDPGRTDARRRAEGAGDAQQLGAALPVCERRRPFGMA